MLKIKNKVQEQEQISHIVQTVHIVAFKVYMLEKFESI